MKTILKNKGHEVEIFYKWPDDETDVFYNVVKYKPDIVGFSLSHKHTGLKPLLIGAEILKRELPNVHITAGGVFVTFNAERALNKYQKLDSVIMGEAEAMICDFVDAVTNNKNLEEVDGLAYRDKDNVIKLNKKTKYIYNIEEIPYPDRDYIEKYKKNASIISASMVGSRGCYGKCHFCNVPAMYSTYGEHNRWRGRSVKDIVDEMQFLNSKYNVLVFNFSDSSFEDANPLSEGKNRLREFANEILSRGLRVFYSCCFRAETFKDTDEDNKLISLLVKSGLYNILIGVEAGNKRALNNFSKRANVEDNLECLEVFGKYPIYISKGFMMFTPQSTYDTLKENLEFAKHSRITEEFIYLTTITSVFDGTPFVTDLQKEGLLDIEYDWEDEYPFKWIDSNVQKLAQEMLKIRKEIMQELEFSQYYGRSNIILSRISNGYIDNEIQYRNWKIKLLRDRMSDNSYEFFDKCLDIVRSGWKQEYYEELKNHYINGKFMSIVKEMELESKKFNRLLKQNCKDVNEMINKYMKGE